MYTYILCIYIYYLICIYDIPLIFPTHLPTLDLATTPSPRPVTAVQFPQAMGFSSCKAVIPWKFRWNDVI